MFKTGSYHNILQCTEVFQVSKMWDNNYMAAKKEYLL